jgi:hypothetical protein
MASTALEVLGAWGSIRGFGHSQASQVGGTSIRYTRRQRDVAQADVARPFVNARDVKGSTRPMMALHPAAIPVQPEVGIDHRPREPHQIQNAEMERNGDDGAVWEGGPNYP